MMARSRVLTLISNKDPTMTLELTLPAMTCGHCVKTISAAAQRLDPAARVQADLATHRVTIDSSAAPAAIEAALAAEGYPATAADGSTRT
jgi:copper chaperone